MDGAKIFHHRFISLNFFINIHDVASRRFLLDLGNLVLFLLRIIPPHLNGLARLLVRRNVRHLIVRPLRRYELAIGKSLAILNSPVVLRIVGHVFSALLFEFSEIAKARRLFTPVYHVLLIFGNFDFAGILFDIMALIVNLTTVFNLVAK